MVVWLRILVTEPTIRYNEADPSPQRNHQHTWSNSLTQSHLQEGEPHYATMGWVERLAAVAQTNPSKKLATHLCKRRDNDVLKGDNTFLEALQIMGFRQVQINATARNRASVSLLSSCVGNFAGLVRRHSQLEFLHPNRIERNKVSRRD